MSRLLARPPILEYEMEMNGSVKHTSLLQSRDNYRCETFYSSFRLKEKHYDPGKYYEGVKNGKKY